MRKQDLDFEHVKTCAHSHTSWFLRLGKMYINFLFTIVYSVKEMKFPVKTPGATEGKCKNSLWSFLAIHLIEAYQFYLMQFVFFSNFP